MTNTPTKKTMREKFRTVLEVAAHTMVLLIPIWSAGILHESDSLIHQIPSDESIADHEGLAEIGFGIRHFSFVGILNSTDYAEDVSFSDEQQDALGGYHTASHILYHFLHGSLWISLCAPLGFYFYRRWVSKESPLLNASKLSKSLATMAIPLIIGWSLLMLIPFFLLTRSNLCDSKYMELGFELEADSSDSEDDGDHCGSEWIGTYASVVDDVSSTCEIFSPSSIGFLVSRLVIPFLLIIQARFLNHRAHQLETKHQLEQVLSRRDFTVEKDIEDSVVKEIDDAATVTSESLE